MSVFCRKVLFYNYSSGRGGAEISLLELLENIDRSRFLPVLFTFDDKSTLAKKVSELNISVIGIAQEHRPFFYSGKTDSGGAVKRLINFIRWLKVPLLLAAAAKKEEASLIHTNNFMSHITGAVASFMAGIPCVWHIRDTFGLFSLHRFLLFSVSFILRPYSISISDFVKQKLPFPLRQKSRRVYNGVTVKSTQKKRSVLYSKIYNTGDFLVLFSGRLVPWKGVGILIEAMNCDSISKLPVKLVIAGETLYWKNNYEKNLREFVRSEALEDKVFFTGYIENIFDYIHSCDLFVSASLNEPFGRSPAEAMAAGKPVLAHQSGGPAEYIKDGENGFFTTGCSPEAYAEKIAELYEHRDSLPEVGRRASETAKRLFNPENYADSVSKVFIEAAGERGRD
ncbi:MAG: glycosyltransferase family 4 protein [Fibrobacterota bacterium]